MLAPKMLTAATTLGEPEYNTAKATRTASPAIESRAATPCVTALAISSPTVYCATPAGRVNIALIDMIGILLVRCNESQGEIDRDLDLTPPTNLRSDK